MVNANLYPHIVQVKEVAQVAVAVVLLVHMIQQVMEAEVVQGTVQAMAQTFFLEARVAADGEHPVAMAILLRVVQGELEVKQLINLDMH
jgi:hypothetical protein